ncbi:uncharacterized protein PG998_010054 [Apiospora kogelbergensis]|uniref:uncharacterized protein n=1 Tax=Apiospora kogelbergensis TaxID=1337665 RepID=UPI00312F192A
MSFLWPCPKCFKAARKKYMKAKQEQHIQKKEKNKNETRNRPPIKSQLMLPSSNSVQLSGMDFPPWYNQYYPQPSMVYAAPPNDEHGHCYCSQCLDDHKKRVRGKYHAPRNPSMTGSFNCVLANFGGGVASPLLTFTTTTAFTEPLV